MVYLETKYTAGECVCGTWKADVDHCVIFGAKDMSTCGRTKDKDIGYFPIGW